MSTILLSEQINQVKVSQPKGLFVLFFAEAWERFSYYGMRALLVLYMTKHLMFSDNKAYTIYGAYGALVYGVSIIGGYVADRFTGSRYTVYLGGIIISLGHICMILPSIFPNLGIEEALLFALSLIIVGTGFFKGNVAALVGQLYQINDIRRDSGYTLFYMGINIGAFLAPLICGYVGEEIGWHYGFSLAGFGMLTGLAILFFGNKYLGDAGKQPLKLTSWNAYGNIFKNTCIVLGTLLSLIPIVYLMFHGELSNYILHSLGVMALIMITICILKSTPDERKCLLTLLFMFPFVMSFFACSEQFGSSINLFIDRHIDRVVFGHTLPTTCFLSIYGMFVFLLAPIFANAWTWLSKRNMDPLAPTKFALGLLQAGLGFGALLIAIRGIDLNGMANVWWLILAFFLLATGELCLSPIGMSMVSKISPPRLIGFMMGCFYLALAFSHLVAAGVAKIASIPEGYVIKNHLESVSGFHHAFEVLFYFPVIASIVMLLISPLMKNVFKVHR